MCPCFYGTVVLPEASCLLTSLAFLLEQKSVQSDKLHQKLGWEGGGLGCVLILTPTG